MIHIGTRVRMSAFGRKVFQNSESNPHYALGTVTQNERKKLGPFNLDCAVDWDNSTYNSYDYEHLEVIHLDKKLEDYL